MTDLFCPYCEYNLTGLTKNRCPECGQPFEGEAIQRLAASAPKAISPITVGFHLLWPPVAFGLLVLMAAWADVEFLFGTLGLAWLVCAAANGAVLAGRISATRAICAGRPPYSRTRMGREMLRSLGLFIFQLILAIGVGYVLLPFFRWAIQ